MDYDFTYTGSEIQAILDTAKKLKDSGYIFLGVATPSTNPSTPTQKVYYEAKQAGTYTNFGGVVLPDGISLLKWNGSWTSETVMCGDGGVFDISVYKSSGGTLAKYTDLAAALGTDGANIPSSLRKGGMSVKFVQSSDNKYVQARCMAQSFTTDVTQWQGVDDEPTAGSNNLVKSGGVAAVFGSYDDGTDSFEDYLDTDKVLIETLNTDGDRVSGRNNFDKEYNIVISKDSTALFKASEEIRHTGICCHITGASSLTHDYDYRSHVSDALKDVGAEFVRSDFPIDDTEATSAKLENSLYQLSRNGIKPLAILSFARDLSIKDTVLSLIAQAVRKYNGVTDIYPEDAGGESVHINIDYWELLNEVDNVNIEIIATYTREIYELIKSIDPNKKVVMTSLSSISKAKLREILEYQFEDEHYLTEFFDILNVHLYGSYNIVKYQLKNLYKALVYREETIGEKSLNKPIWITETGASLYNYTEAEQAVLLVTRILIYRSMGADIVFPFQLRGSCNSFGRTISPVELYYGITRDCIANSYISLLNGHNESLSKGDGYKKYTIHGETENVYIGSYEVENLKDSGLNVSGDNYHLLSVKLIHNGEVSAILFTGDSVIDSSHSVYIDESDFSEVATGDYLRFEISDANVTNEWAGIQKNKAYSAIKYLHSIIGNNVPTFEFSQKGVTGISIIGDNDTPVFVLINDSTFSSEVQIETDEINWLIYDFDGNLIEKDIHNFIIEPLSITYISNIKKFNISIKEL